MAKYVFDTTLERSKLMRSIKSINTKPELMLRKELWALGLRYRLNVAKLPGKPDIVFGKQKLAIFIDGEFWHGYKWDEKKPKIKANRDYWINKIERNIQRDERCTLLLKGMGYTVLRFWEHDIKKSLPTCLSLILASLSKNELQN
jgi:DNA mismatch endonuclease (patch repair protein)